MKERFSGINIGCIFFAITVIAIHTSPFIGIENTLFEKIILLVYELAVPFFY